MRVVALVSGGKDSCYNMMQCMAAGHHMAALAHLTPAERRVRQPGLNADDDDAIEVDSFMYQSVGCEAVSLYAMALELPLYQKTFEADTALCLAADYVPTAGDEVEALHQLLVEVKANEQVEAVSVGAILSNYQRVRVENVCSRLGLTVLAYMWRRNQEELLAEMIAANLRAIVVKVASLGLTPAQHLGKEISEIYPHLLQMNERYGLNVCGEGGEYETFTLDCPLFKKSIVIEEQVTIVQDSNDISPVAYLRLVKCSLQPKPTTSQMNMNELGIRGPLNFLVDLDVDLSVVDGGGPAQLNDEEPSRDFPTWQRKASSTLVTSLGGGWVSISGIVAFRDDDSNDVATATSNALRRLTDALLAASLSMAQLVSVQLFVQNMDDFGAINAAYKKFFDLNPPSRVCVQVPLPKDVCLLMDCVAYRGEQVVKHMHVQGVSHWAPANIGPYSQAVHVTDDVTHVAGQIALVPGTMHLIADPVAQCRLSLRHVRRVLDAIQPAGSCRRIPEDFVSCVCYVTRASYIQMARDALHWGSDRSSVDDQHVVYVVVTGLPRGSSVEWQVVAGSSSTIKRTQLGDAIVDDLVHVVSSLATNGLTVLQSRCSSSKSPGSELAESMLCDVFVHIHGLVMQTSTDGSNLAAAEDVDVAAHYQVFFNVNTVAYDQLDAAWQTAMGTMDDDHHKSNGLTLIPVLAAHHTDNSVFMNVLVRV